MADGAERAANIADMGVIKDGAGGFALKNFDGHGSHPFPAPGTKPDGAAKGEGPLVGNRHGRQGTELRLGRLWLSMVRVYLSTWTQRSCCTDTRIRRAR